MIYFQLFIGSLTSDPIVNYHDIAREFEFFFKRYRNDAKRFYL